MSKLAILFFCLSNGGWFWSLLSLTWGGRNGVVLYFVASSLLNYFCIDYWVGCFGKRGEPVVPCVWSVWLFGSRFIGSLAMVSLWCGWGCFFIGLFQLVPLDVLRSHVGPSVYHVLLGLIFCYWVHGLMVHGIGAVDVRLKVYILGFDFVYGFCVD